MRNLFICTLLLFLAGCMSFTKADFDRVEDLQSTRVEFLKYPNIKFEKDGTAYYPVSYLPSPQYHWRTNGQHKKLVISYPTQYIRISQEHLAKHNTNFYKSGEDESCFEFPIKKLSGWVGEATFVPMERCVKSEKIPFDSAKRELQWFATNFKWRIEWD